MVTLNHQRVVSEYVALTLMKILQGLSSSETPDLADKVRRLFLKLLLLVQRFHQSNVCWHSDFHALNICYSEYAGPRRILLMLGLEGFSLRQVGQVMFILHRRLRRLYGEDDPPAPEPEAGRESEDGSWILL